MKMRIIKEGKLPEKEIWSGECHNCKTVAEAERGELQVTYDQRDGSLGRASCPLCHKEMHFYPKAGSGNSASYFDR